MKRDHQKGLEALTFFLKNLFEIFKVIYEGVRTNTFPWTHAAGLMGFIGLLLISKMDIFVAGLLGVDLLYPYHDGLYLTYSLFLLSLPILGWGAVALRRKRTLNERLTGAFINSDLRTKLGKVPQMISDRPLDEFSRKLTLKSSGKPLSEFEAAKESLEAELQIFIDEIKGNLQNGIIEILYAFVPMPDYVNYPTNRKFTNLSFPVGLNRSKLITGSLKESPHLLVAGQTGGGKSSFMRSLATSIYRQHKGVDFTMIDLKDGAEFGIFEKYKRVEFASDTKTSLPALRKIEKVLEGRGKYLKSAGCTDLDHYYKKVNKSNEELPKPTDNMRRQIVVVDEAADLFLASTDVTAKQAAECRKILSAIARKGRALGIHLVLGTQRPDVKSLDPQIKANLTSVVCFQMKNNASSMTVLDSGRASHLPEIPGRAIWKKGNKMMELQTPHLTPAEVEAMLVDHLKPAPKNEEKTSKSSQPEISDPSQETPNDKATDPAAKKGVNYDD